MTNDAIESERRMWKDILEETRRDLQKCDIAHLVDTQETRDTVYHFVVAVGKCDRYAVGVSDDDWQMVTPAVARIAIAELERFIAQVRGDVANLENNLTNAEGLERESACVDILACRETIAAVYGVLVHTFINCDENDPEFVALSHDINALHPIIQALDSDMRCEARLLCLATVTDALNNQRTLLNDEFKKRLPWWLDGTLEKMREVTDISARLDEIAASLAKNRMTRQFLDQINLN